MGPGDFKKDPDAFINDLAKRVPEDPNEPIGDVGSDPTDEAGFETKLITMPAEEAQELVARFPDHGNGEAVNKIFKILQYGPNYKTYKEYATAMEELTALAKYWNLNKDTIRAEMQSQIDECPDIDRDMIPKMEQFFQQNAGIFKS